MSCPTNEPYVDFSVLRTLKIDENIRNPLMFLRKMATCSCFAGPIDIKIHASMYFMSICPLAHIKKESEDCSEQLKYKRKRENG